MPSHCPSAADSKAAPVRQVPQAQAPCGVTSGAAEPALRAMPRPAPARGTPDVKTRAPVSAKPTSAGLRGRA
eukprot:9055966-Alexandrium_andersonii.AAC.1